MGDDPVHGSRGSRGKDGRLHVHPVGLASSVSDQDQDEGPQEDQGGDLQRSHGWGGDVGDGHLPNIAEGRGTETNRRWEEETGWEEDRKVLSPWPAANLQGGNAATTSLGGETDPRGWLTSMVC